MSLRRGLYPPLTTDPGVPCKPTLPLLCTLEGWRLSLSSMEGSDHRGGNHLIRSLEPPKVKGDKALRKIIVALILLNIALAVAHLWSRPIALPSRIDCCRDEGPEAYCCKQCCWLGFDCTTDEECRDS